MNLDSDKIEIINNLLDKCFLPELLKDFGETYLNTSHFDDFRKNLDVNLIQLFDLIQSNENFFYTDEKETLELRYKLLLLLCEQSAPDTLYQTHNPSLLNNINCLIVKHFMKILDKNQDVKKNILDYYKNRLNSKLCKRNLGAIHGFVKFCELYYEQHSQELDSNTATFVLSVGLLLRDFYEPLHKQLGYELLHIILERTPNDIIKEINIHNVIYDAVFQDFKKVDSEKSLEYILKCILICLSYFEITDFHQWNKIDDLINEFMYRIVHINVKICKILFIYLSKIILKFSNNSKEIEYEMNLTEMNFIEFNRNVDEIRDKCEKITSVIPYKWVKKILHLFTSESNYLLINSDNCRDLLLAMHILYLTSIYPIPFNISDVHLNDLLNTFPGTLTHISRMNEQEPDLIKVMVRDWLHTFQKQISQRETLKTPEKFESPHAKSPNT